jgi:acetyl/propionyl-CoA carboxylase alpha subunit
MIAKLIVYGEDRPAALARLQSALNKGAVFGVKTIPHFCILLLPTLPFRKDAPLPVSCLTTL